MSTIREEFVLRVKFDVNHFQFGDFFREIRTFNFNVDQSQYGDRDWKILNLFLAPDVELKGVEIVVNKTSVSFVDNE